MNAKHKCRQLQHSKIIIDNFNHSRWGNERTIQNEGTHTKDPRQSHKTHTQPYPRHCVGAVCPWSHLIQSMIAADHNSSWSQAQNKEWVPHTRNVWCPSQLSSSTARSAGPNMGKVYPVDITAWQTNSLRAISRTFRKKSKNLFFIYKFASSLNPSRMTHLPTDQEQILFHWGISTTALRVHNLRIKQTVAVRKRLQLSAEFRLLRIRRPEFIKYRLFFQL